MMTRKWLPADWLDEYVPALGVTPEEFLQRDAEGRLMLAPLPGDEDCSWEPRAVAAGEVLGFCWTETHEAQALTIRADGSWSLDAPFPDTANCFRRVGGEYEDIWNDIGELVDNFLEAEPDEAIGVHPLDAWTWSDTIRFRVVVRESGAVSLVEVAV